MAPIRELRVKVAGTDRSGSHLYLASLHSSIDHVNRTITQRPT
jgi:hypothetical protein